MNGASVLPRFQVVQRALRATTERLASELREPGPAVPDWNEFEWHVARAVAAMQGISGLLAGALRWRGPDHWHQFLERQRAQSRLRHALATQLLADLAAALRAQGIGAVALKGAAMELRGLYSAGDRPMGDVDLLVSPADTEPAARALGTLDYAPAIALRRNEVFVRAGARAGIICGEHIDNPLKIELHVRVAEALPVHEVDITSRLHPDTPGTGLLAYRDRAALLAHLLLHAAGNMRANALRQIQLHDIARLGARLDASEWARVLQLPQPGGPWWMLPPLELVARYYAGAVPRDVLATLRTACPRRLRAAAARACLTDVSWSNLRIAALPGLAWARSPGEAFEYARRRLLPGRIDRAELAAALQTQPRMLDVRWYGASQRERIVRWLFGRPRRVQTLVSLRAALAGEF